MEYFIFWLFFSIVAGIIASMKGRSGFGFFFLSIILSPLIGIILALVAEENRTKVEKKKISSGENKKCPYCAEIIKREAAVCRYCGKEFWKVHSDEKSEETPNSIDHLAKYCSACLHFQEQTGVCVKFFINVRDYPQKFFEACNGEFYESDGKIHFSCDNCGAKYMATKEQGGKSAKCKKCGSQILAPDSSISE